MGTGNQIFHRIFPQDLDRESKARTPWKASLHKAEMRSGFLEGPLPRGPGSETWTGWNPSLQGDGNADKNISTPYLAVLAWLKCQMALFMLQ